MAPLVDRDMVWKLGWLQSADNELRFDVETVLTVHKSFVYRLLIFKQDGWAIKPKRCYWKIGSLYQKYNGFSDRAQNCIKSNKKIEQRL